MCNISYPSLNTLNRLIIVITCVAGQSASNTPTGITHLYIPEYRSPVLNQRGLLISCVDEDVRVCCYGDVYCFSNMATSRPGMLDLCLLADSPGPIDSLSLYLLFYVMQLMPKIYVSLASHQACSQRLMQEFITSFFFGSV